jgi:hypothetical protein
MARIGMEGRYWAMSRAVVPFIVGVTRAFAFSVLAVSQAARAMVVAASASLSAGALSFIRAHVLS